MKKAGIIAACGLAGVLLTLLYALVIFPKTKKVLYTGHYTVGVKFNPGYEHTNTTGMEEIKQMLSNRLKGFGSSFMIQVIPEKKQLDIDIRGMKDSTRASRLLTENGHVHFTGVYPISYTVQALQKIMELHGQNQTAVSVPETVSQPDTGLNDLLPKEPVAQKQEKTKPDEDVPFIHPAEDYSGSIQQPVYIPETGYVKSLDSAELRSLVNNPRVQSLLPRDAFLYFAMNSTMPAARKGQIAFYFARDAGDADHAVLQNRDIRTAEGIMNAAGRPELNLVFTPDGSGKWESLTRTETGKGIAIVFDGRVIAAPVVLDVIYGGRAAIAGNFDMDEVQDMARLLRSGQVPCKLNLLHKEQQREMPDNQGRILLLCLLSFLLCAGLGWVLFNKMTSS